MLDFFRRYQRYFFLVITVVTIVSFSFFGTYSTVNSNTWRDQVAFKAINGHDVTRSDVDEMAAFIATDNDDKILYGGVWGPNFLNDGVIRKDFLETGLADELVAAYAAELQDDLQKRLEKEKKYSLYHHPQARFINVENSWNYFIPEMSTYFQKLRKVQDPTDREGFAARRNLFLAEKKFPSPTLRQVLRYQERQYSWLSHDPKLDQTDLSLFGYHTLEDWFGPRFTRLVSQFIINTAILAEQKGYDVSKAEVLADLVRQTELSYQQNKQSESIGVASPEQYFNEQLRRLNMDQSRAIKTWRQVMLFRRYFQDVGSLALIDVLNAQAFNNFAYQTLVADVYQLPAELRFGDYKTLQNFEAYLQAVSKPDKKDPLSLPSEFLAVEEVAKKYPELVQKRYRLEVAKVNKKNLQTRIGVKETWNWEVADTHWPTLQKQFPELGSQKGETREERYTALESLDPITRSKVDQFARAAIVDERPEWIDKALADVQVQEIEVGLRPQGGKMPIEGLETQEQRMAFIELLDQAPLAEQPSSDSKLNRFTADQQNYYRLTVLEKAEKPKVLTFAEANQDGTAEKVRTRLLEAYYVANREKTPSLYQDEKKAWKPFNLVQDQVADQYFDRLLKSLQQIQQSVAGKEESEKPISKDLLATFRFYPLLQQAKFSLEKDPSQTAQWIATDNQEQSSEVKGTSSLGKQWLLVKNEQMLDRHKQQLDIDIEEAFSLPTYAWSSIHTPNNGDLAFFQVKEAQDNPEKHVRIAEQTKLAHQLLSWEAQRLLMQKVLAEITSRNAISLAYLNQPVEDPESDSQEASEITSSEL